MKRPTEPGLYWVRSSKNYSWYNFIVKVGGEQPYLKIEWVIDTGIEPGMYVKVEDHKIDKFIWGPKIEIPKVEILNETRI